MAQTGFHLYRVFESEACHGSVLQNALAAYNDAMSNSEARPALVSPVVKILLLANVIMFFLEPGSMRFLITHFALWPLPPPGPVLPDAGSFQPWQLISYAFLHGSLMHLLLNMYALWLFGTALEQLWGSRNFALYYFLSVLGAGLTQLLVVSGSSQPYPTIGASGGVFGILLAYGMFFPNHRLMLLFPPVAIKAIWFVVIYGVITLIFGITGTASGVAHFAHLGGMLTGFLMILYWLQHPPKRR